MEESSQKITAVIKTRYILRVEDFRENGNRKNNTGEKKNTKKTPPHPTTMGVRTRGKDPKYSRAEILTEILIGLNEKLLEIYVCESTRGLNAEQSSK